MSSASKLCELIDAEELETALSAQNKPVKNSPRTAAGRLFSSMSNRNRFDLQINALLPRISKTSPTPVSIDLIDPNPWALNNEINYDEDPVIVRRVQSDTEIFRYQLFSGNNKIHSCRVLGINSIDCFVLELSDVEMKPAL